MKEITLEDVLEFIEDEKLSEMEVMAIMRAVRHQDDVLGDIVVCRQDVRDIARCRLNVLNECLEDEDGDFENMADEVVRKVGENAFADVADFWDSLESMVKEEVISMVDEEVIGILADHQEKD